jgi:hypothetical protein
MDPSTDSLAAALLLLSEAERIAIAAVKSLGQVVFQDPPVPGFQPYAFTVKDYSYYTHLTDCDVDAINAQVATGNCRDDVLKQILKRKGELNDAVNAAIFALTGALCPAPTDTVERTVLPLQTGACHFSDGTPCQPNMLQPDCFALPHHSEWDRGQLCPDIPPPIQKPAQAASPEKKGTP